MVGPRGTGIGVAKADDLAVNWHHAADRPRA